jgi:hypothetical protein
MVVELLEEGVFRLASLPLQAPARHHFLPKLLIEGCPDTHQRRQRACQKTQKGRRKQVKSYHPLGREACRPRYSGRRSPLIQKQPPWQGQPPSPYSGALGPPRR